MTFREQSIYVVSSVRSSMIVRFAEFFQRVNFVVHYRTNRISPKHKLNMGIKNLSKQNLVLLV